MPAGEFINPAISRLELGRCLWRHGVGHLETIQSELEGETLVQPKSFKDHEPGLDHVDNMPRR